MYRLTCYGLDIVQVISQWPSHMGDAENQQLFSLGSRVSQQSHFDTEGLEHS